MTAIEQSYPRITGRLVLLAAAMFVVGTNAFVIAGLLPDIAADLGVTPHDVSFSITAYSLVVAVGAPAISILLPRVPRPTLMGAGLALFVVGAAITALAPTMTVFTVGRALAGLGGAALVPTATAAAAALARPDQRGRALGLVATGFTLATAAGAPFGTALGGLAGWQTPIWILVGLGAGLAVAVLVVVRDVPLPPPSSLARRFAPLRNGRVLAPLGTTLTMIAAFNIVYIFSSVVTAGATGGSSTLLAALLLCYGVAGIVGNAVAGPLTDRFGSRIAAPVALGGQAVVLLLLPLAAGSLPFTAVLFVLWGLVAFACAIPVQHRLVAVDPPTSALALSWYSTAMYLGIAVAPVVGSAALSAGGAQALPVAGAVISALAAVIFLLGYRSSSAGSVVGDAGTEARPEQVRGQQRRHGHEEHTEEDVESLHL